MMDLVSSTANNPDGATYNSLAYNLNDKTLLKYGYYLAKVGAGHQRCSAETVRQNDVE